MRHAHGFLRWLAGCLLLALALTLSAQAQGLQPVPALSDRVIDQAGVLGSGRAALVEQLARLERETGAQLVVLTLATTQPEDIAAYAHRVADQWKIGRREIGDGLLIVVAVQDRRMRIEVARTLEGAVPDVVAGRIIRERMAPAFRQGDYAGGISAAVSQIDGLIRGEKLPAPEPDTHGESGSHDTTGAGDEDIPWLLTGAFVVPVVARVLVSLTGRLLGPLLSGGVGVLLGALLGGGAMIPIVALGVLGFGVAVLMAISSAIARVTDTRGGSGWSWSWSDGGSSSSDGSSSSGGGFSSGGGGSFGGGGSSGGW
jgi:uncharacterized protein